MSGGTGIGKLAKVVRACAAFWPLAVLVLPGVAHAAEFSCLLEEDTREDEIDSLVADGDGILVDGQRFVPATGNWSHLEGRFSVLGTFDIGNGARLFWDDVSWAGTGHRRAVWYRKAFGAPLEPVQVDGLQYANDVARDGAAVVIGNTNGVFRADRPGSPFHKISGISAQAVREYDGALFVAGDGGVFRKAPDGGFEQVASAPAIPASEHPWIVRFTNVGHSLFIWFSMSEPQTLDLMRLDSANGNPVAVPASRTGRLSDVVEHAGRYFAAADKGVFEFLDTTKQFVALKQFPAKATRAVGAGDRLVTLGDDVVRQWDYGDGDAVVIDAGSVGYLSALVAFGGELYAGGMGLFKSRSEPLSSANLIRLLPKDDDLSQLHPGKAQPIEVKAEFTHVCAAALGSVHYVATDAEGHRISGPATLDAPPADRYRSVQIWRKQPRRFDASVPFTGGGRWKVAFYSDRSGAQIGRVLNLNLPESPLLAMGKFLAAAAFALYLVAYIALFGLARWSAWCRRVIADPVWSAIGVWPYFVLRQVPQAQYWLLNDYFEAAQLGLDKSEYLDVPVTAEDGSVALGSDLLGRLAVEPHIWLQGNAGMGKTAVVGALQRLYFDRNFRSLDAARKAFGFVLIVLNVRKYADLPFDPQYPERWVLEAIRRRLAEQDNPIFDVSLVEAMLRSGSYAVVLDGMNEAERDGAVASIADIARLRLLATSQGDGLAGFRTWRLPRNIKSHVEQLIACYRDTDFATALMVSIRRQGLLEYLQSGYDVRLIIDIAGGNSDVPLPKDRIGLYHAVLGRATASDGSPLDLDRLKEVAWSMVLSKSREITPKERLAIGEEILEKLEAPGVRVVRRVGEVLEFRHDQMRTFLAASHLVDNAPNAQAMAQRLAGSAVWECSRKEQEELWKFVALLIDASAVNELWRMAIVDPARGFLQHAMQSRADILGIVLARTPPDA